MTSTPSRAPRARTAIDNRITRLAAIVVVFALFGPPIGGFSLIAMAAAISLEFTASPLDLVPMAVFGMIYGAAIGYLIGMIPAAAVGLAVAVWQEFVGRFTWAVVLGLGIITGLAFLYGIQHGHSTQFRAADAALVLTCVIPTTLCWLVVRKRFFRPPATEAFA